MPRIAQHQDQGPHGAAAPGVGIVDQPQAAEVQLHHFARRSVLHADGRGIAPTPVTALDETLQRGVGNRAAPGRLQPLDARQLQPVPGQPLVDLVGPRGQLVLGGCLRPPWSGTADCCQMAELLLVRGSTVQGYAQPLRGRGVLANGVFGNTCTRCDLTPALAQLPAANDFQYFHSENLLICHHHPSHRSAVMVSHQALKVS